MSEEQKTVEEYATELCESTSKAISHLTAEAILAVLVSNDVLELPEGRRLKQGVGTFEALRNALLELDYTCSALKQLRLKVSSEHFQIPELMLENEEEDNG